MEEKRWITTEQMLEDLKNDPERFGERCRYKNTKNLGNKQKRREKLADIRKSVYLCSVKGTYLG